MNSTPNSEQTNPSVISIAPGEKLVSDEQALREELARLNERRSVVPDVGTLSLDPQATSFRPNAVGGSSGIMRTALRGLVGALLVGCISAAAFAWQSSYGHTVRSIVAELAPQLIPSSLLPGGRAEPEAPSGSATVQAAAADAAQPAADTAADANAQQAAEAHQQPTAPAPAQTTPPAAAQAAVQDAATAAASSSPPDQAQLLQTMARDLAAAQQKIAELEASQQQLARDNAATAAQLKSAQDQVAHLLAKPEPKVSEARPPEPGPSNAKVYAQALKPKPPAAPRRPVVTTYARPVAATMPRPLAPPQTAAQPLAPAPLPAPIVQPPEDAVQMTSAPRPPMPVPQ